MAPLHERIQNDRQHLALGARHRRDLRDLEPLGRAPAMASIDDLVAHGEQRVIDPALADVVDEREKIRIVVAPFGDEFERGVNGEFGGGRDK